MITRSQKSIDSFFGSKATLENTYSTEIGKTMNLEKVSTVKPKIH